MSLLTMWSGNETRSHPLGDAFSHQALVDWFTHQGHLYGLTGMPGSKPDIADGTFASMIDLVHRRHGPVSAAVAARALVMSQVRFQWKRSLGTTGAGELYGTPGLSVLDRPRPLTRTELLFRLELDVSYAGNAYLVRDNEGIKRLPPDRVTFILGSNSEPGWNGDGDVMLPYDTEVVALVYNPNTNPNQTANSTVFLPGEYAHWKPEPDPEHFWRGASWITSLINDVALDGQISHHQRSYFGRAATPNLVVMMDPGKTPDEVKAYAEIMNRSHAGLANSWRNMYLGGGTDVKVVGNNLKDLSLRDLEGGLETNVAMRSRVPGVILGVREGYSGSSLNTGNYAAARRMWADGWFSPTVDNLCESLELIVPPPAGSHLSHDPAQVLFLQEDQKDAADIMSTKAQAVATLVREGWEADDAVAAVETNSLMKLLGAHNGLPSVQQQPAEGSS